MENSQCSLSVVKEQYRRRFFRYLQIRNKEEKETELVYLFGKRLGGAFLTFEVVRAIEGMHLNETKRAVQEVVEFYKLMQQLKEERGVSSPIEDSDTMFHFKEINRRSKIHFDDTFLDNPSHLAKDYYEMVRKIEPTDVLKTFYQLFCELVDENEAIQNEYRLLKMFEVK